MDVNLEMNCLECLILRDITQNSFKLVFINIIYMHVLHQNRPAWLMVISTLKKKFVLLQCIHLET